MSAKLVTTLKWCGTNHTKLDVVLPNVSTTRERSSIDMFAIIVQRKFCT